MNIHLGKGTGKIAVGADISLHKKDHHESPAHDDIKHQPHPEPHHDTEIHLSAHAPHPHPHPHPSSVDYNLNDLLNEIRTLKNENKKLVDEKISLESTVLELNNKVNSLEHEVTVQKQTIEQYEHVHENQKISHSTFEVDVSKTDVQIVEKNEHHHAADIHENFEEKLPNHKLSQDLETGHQDQIFSLISSPNAQHVFSGSADHTIRVWKDANFSSNRSIQSEKMIGSSPSFSLDKVLTGHTNIITALSSTFLNDRDEQDLVVVSGSEDATLKMFHIETGECRFSSRSDYISGVSISSGLSKLIASVSANNNHIKIYDSSHENTPKNPIKAIQHHGCTGILAVSFLSNAEKLLVLDLMSRADIFYSSVNLYDVETSQLLASMKSKHLEEDFYFNSNIVIPSHNNNVIISSVSYDPKMIKIHDLRSGNLVHDILHSDNSSSNDIKLIPADGCLVSITDNKLNILNYYHDHLISTIHGKDDFFCAVVASPNSNFIGAAEEVSNHILFYN